MILKFYAQTALIRTGFATCSNRRVLKLQRRGIFVHECFAICDNLKRMVLKLCDSLSSRVFCFAICTNRVVLKPHDSSRPAWQCCLSVSQSRFCLLGQGPANRPKDSIAEILSKYYCDVLITIFFKYFYLTLKLFFKMTHQNCILHHSIV